MQFQMSSMTTLGDPIAYFMNYPGRFLSCHLQAVDAAQGMRAAAPARLPVKGEAPQGRRGGGGGTPLALGEDTADWPRIFAAAKTGGLKYPFVEQGDMCRSWNWGRNIRWCWSCDQPTIQPKPMDLPVSSRA